MNWQKLVDRMNERTIKNTRIGAMALIIETGIMPFDITGQIDTTRWEQIEAQNAPVRKCDAQAWFLTSEFAETEAKSGDRVINDETGETYVILSAEPRNDGVTHCLLRRYTE